jgi:hypothetical protein
MILTSFPQKTGPTAVLTTKEKDFYGIKAQRQTVYGEGVTA